MSDDILIARDGMEMRLNAVLEYVTEVDQALGTMPAAPNGGTASSMIALIASAAAEASGLAADIVRLLSAITIDVMDDLLATDVDIAEELRTLDQNLEAP